MEDQDQHLAAMEQSVASTRVRFLSGACFHVPSFELNMQVLIQAIACAANPRLHKLASMIIVFALFTFDFI